MKVYLGGEGPHELGCWAEQPERRSTSTRGEGVLAALARRINREFSVLDAKRWKDIRKYRAGAHRDAEERNLRGLELEARERGADVLLWSRDTDQHSERRQQLEKAMKALEETSTLAIAGCPVDPCIESWALALAQRHSQPDELSTKQAQALAEKDDVHTGAKMEQLAQEASLDDLSSASLQRWLELCRAALSTAAGD